MATNPSRPRKAGRRSLPVKRLAPRGPWWF